MVIEGQKKIVLTRRTVNKNGDVAYSREGVRSTVYANKGMFVGNAPETISLECKSASFTAPKPGVDPAEVKAQAEKAQVRAQKAEARAQKAYEVAKKHKATAIKASKVSSGQDLGAA